MDAPIRLTIVGCVNHWVSGPFCSVTVVVAVLAYLALILGLVLTVRLGYLVRNFFCPQMLIQLGSLAYIAIICIYLTVWDHFIVFMSVQFLKVTILFSVVGFFAFSVLRFAICPNFITPILWLGFITLYTPTIITYGFSIWVWETRGEACANHARFAFSIFEFVACLLFGVTSILTSRRVAKKVAVSSSYMVRHTRPMVTINLIYLWMAIVGLSLQIFFHVSSLSLPGSSCRELLLGYPDWVPYSYGIFLWIQLIAPPLVIYWYFYKTVNKNKQVDIFGIDDPSSPSWTTNTQPPIFLSINTGSGKYVDYRSEALTVYSERALDDLLDSDSEYHMQIE